MTKTERIINNIKPNKPLFVEDYETYEPGRCCNGGCYAAFYKIEALANGRYLVTGGYRHDWGISPCGNLSDGQCKDCNPHRCPCCNKSWSQVVDIVDGFISRGAYLRDGKLIIDQR